MKHTLSCSHGNVLSYSDDGPRDGYPILVQHGLIASINDCSLFEALIAAGVRVLSMARPGYGESSPSPLSRVAEWGEIACLLADELHLAHFDVLAMSSGAPYGYAIGYRLPHKVRNLFVFSGIPALYDAQVQAAWPYPLDPQAGIPELQKLAKELFFSDLPPAARQQDDMRASMRNDCFGPALDFKLRCNDWGFVLSQVKETVYMQHGRHDNFAPVEITARLLPDCRLEIRESGEHFSPELLDAFLKTSVLPHLGK